MTTIPKGEVKAEEECPITLMTVSQKETLRRSWWRMVGKNPKVFRDFGVKLMLWMTNDIPNALDRFFLPPEAESGVTLSSKPFADLFLSHSQVVIVSIDTLVHYIKQPQTLRTKMRAMLLVHLKQDPEVGLDFFESIRDNFHLLVEDVLAHEDADDTEEVVECWRMLWDSFIKIGHEDEATNLEGTLDIQPQRKKMCVLS